jgi:hypothetical protein
MGRMKEKYIAESTHYTWNGQDRPSFMHDVTNLVFDAESEAEKLNNGQLVLALQSLGSASQMLANVLAKRLREVVPDRDPTPPTEDISF